MKNFLPESKRQFLAEFRLTREIIADNLSKAGWSWGYVSAIDSNGRTVWIADAHCDDGKRFVVRADEKLTAFVELESAIRVAKTNIRVLSRGLWFFSRISCNP
jgi:hypothetical protein